MNSTCELDCHSARALKPYPDYTDSGVESLGKVPAHWEVLKLRHVLRRHTERERPDLPLLSVVREQGVILRDTTSTDENHNYIPDDLSNYKVVRAGQFAMNKMKAWQGSYGVSCHDGIVSPAYFVFDVLGLEVDFFHAAIRSRAYVPAFTRASDGVRIGQWDLAEARMREIQFLVPPAAEQAAIVRFLDYADRRIRRYIRAKQQLITLLEEQKQALIHHAVTRGLDPNVRLKPSGVECLGDIPEHWKTLPLKRWVSTKITDGPHETPALLADGIPFLSAESMVGGCLDFSRRRGFISREQHEVYCRKCRPRRDDIFMCKSGATTGKVAIVETADEFSVWSPLALIRVESHKVLARLLFAVLQTRYVQRQVQDTWSYGTQPNLAMRVMERLVVMLPPLDEQQKVLAHLDRATKKPSEAIGRAQREIVLLREYRTRLIADVVTGKLDVREAAARLPDEVEELEPLDEADALIDGEEEPTDALAPAP